MSLMLITKNFYVCYHQRNRSCLQKYLTQLSGNNIYFFNKNFYIFYHQRD